MLYISTTSRPDWSRPPLSGGWTGGQADSQRRLREVRRSEAVQARESTASLLIDQGAKLAQIRRMYGLRAEAEVVRFLRTHPALIDLLLEAPTHVERYFGPNPQLVLEVVTDPEVPDSEELFANICTPLPVEEALERLDQLDEGWFLDQLERTGGRFNFNLEFV